ncbi:hypothetical protein CMUS01_08748 [Colletotrichum musicola]|uniref:Uncharacterized protein n=1 Tax=Colletotrichum musicola TaxID=2175873 RepID=A0A8H6NCA0_9PEZI|nr:hypothetical protein CMUS01_08748 [Colletotrichum musicola]
MPTRSYVARLLLEGCLRQNPYRLQRRERSAVVDGRGGGLALASSTSTPPEPESSRTTRGRESDESDAIEGFPYAFQCMQGADQL